MNGASFYNAGLLLQIKHAITNIAASTTDGVLTSVETGLSLASVAGLRYVVLFAFAVDGGTATNITFNSKGSGASTPISPQIQSGANSGFVLPFIGCDAGWFRTNQSENITISTGTGSTTGVLVGYVLTQ